MERNEQLKIALSRIEKFIGKICKYKDPYNGNDSDENEFSAYLFDWQKIDPEEKSEFVADIFGDWEDEESGDMEGVVRNADESGECIEPEWIEDGDWIPFALAGIYLEAEEIEDHTSEHLPGYQFGEIWVLKLSDVTATSIPVHVIEVDGTAITVDIKEPERIFDDLSQIELAVRA